MELKELVVVLGVFIIEVATRKCRNLDMNLPQEATKMLLIDNTATPEYDAIVKCPPKFDMHLILPPTKVELPWGLGYFPAAVPYVASCFNAVDANGLCCDRVPVTSSSCITLAAPIDPELASLVKSISL